MNKQLCTEPTIWYDQSVYNAVTALDDKYPNAIAIFGGALGASQYVNCDKPDFYMFTLFLPHIIHNAKFFEWHEGVVGALRRFCHLCYVDPALVELYIGMTFEKLCEVK